MKAERIDMGAVTVLRLSGDIDERGVDALRTQLYDCITGGRFKIVLNMTDVRYISYMGVGVMVERLRKIRSYNGDIKLAGINLYSERLFRMVGVSNLFEIHEGEQQAVNVFQAAA
ncbi:MAG: hypothetical protein AMXMBFR84_06760 [Candidatus Hydrogenedentota bacterium]